MSKKKNKNSGVVYSTNSNFQYDSSQDNDNETLLPNEQLLKVHLEKKGRAGKAVVIIKDFIGTEDDLKELGKTLKSKCGVGGSAKNGEIIIQGEVREKVMAVLEQLGYSTKRIGG